MTVLPIGEMPHERTYAVRTMHNVGLLVTRERHVIRGDRRFAYMQGWELTAVRHYAHLRGWHIAEVPSA